VSLRAWVYVCVHSADRAVALACLAMRLALVLHMEARLLPHRCVRVCVFACVRVCVCLRACVCVSLRAWVYVCVHSADRAVALACLAMRLAVVLRMGARLLPHRCVYVFVCELCLYEPGIGAVCCVWKPFSSVSGICTCTLHVHAAVTHAHTHTQGGPGSSLSSCSR